jgi:hypothetical protein
MLGQSWKRVVTYDRVLGSQGKQIPIPKHLNRHRHRRQVLKPAFLSNTDRRVIKRWAAILGPIALLMGLGTGFLINQVQYRGATPPSLSLPIPTFDSPTSSPTDTIPCVQRVSLLRQDMDQTTGSSSNTATTTKESPSSSTTTLPTSSPSTSSNTDTATRTTRQSSTRKPQPQLKDQPEATSPPTPPHVVTTQIPKANPTIQPPLQQAVPPGKQERLVSSNSQPIRPQPTGQPSTPGQERAALPQSTTSSSASLERQAPLPTNGRNTSVMVSPSKSCSH